MLVKDQSTQAQNGIYEVTTVGDGGTNWVLTRTTDFDAGAEIPSGYTFVEGGDTQAGNGYVCVSPRLLSLLAQLPSCSSSSPVLAKSTLAMV